MWFGHIVYVTAATESGEKTCNKTVRTEKQQEVYSYSRMMCVCVMGDGNYNELVDTLIFSVCK